MFWVLHKIHFYCSLTAFFGETFLPAANMNFKIEYCRCAGLCYVTHGFYIEKGGLPFKTGKVVHILQTCRCTGKLHIRVVALDYTSHPNSSLVYLNPQNNDACHYYSSTFQLPDVAVVLQKMLCVCVCVPPPCLIKNLVVFVGKTFPCYFRAELTSKWWLLVIDITQLTCSPISNT